MLKTLFFILTLRNYYRANSIIFTLRALPYAKRILPVTLFKNRGIKIIAGTIAAVFEVLNIFLTKLIYFGVLFFLIDYIYISFGLNLDFLHVFMFFTAAGVAGNNRFDNATRDSYYAIFLLKVPAKKYALAEMSYFLFKTFVGFAFFSLIGGLFVGLSVAEMVAIPFYVTAFKLTFMPLMINYSKRYSKALGRNYLLAFVALMLAALGIGTGALGFRLSENILVVSTFVFIVSGAVALAYILKYKHFKNFYRKLFVTDIQLIAPGSSKTRQNLVHNTYTKHITNSTKINSSKKGFAYFNDIFVKRHRKILIRNALITAIILFVLCIAITVYCLLDQKFSIKANIMAVEFMPYLLFLMYFINCGNRATLTMFANCDSAMLHYGFYRKPKSLLKNFTHRLLSVIKINLVPGMVLSVGLPVILFASGGADKNINYFLSFACVIAMSVFFSVHSMVLYYLLQPYNAKMELKSPTFTIVNSATYFVCIVAMGRQMPLYTFSLIITFFCIGYILIALFVAYKLAPKTFRLRS